MKGYGNYFVENAKIDIIKNYFNEKKRNIDIGSASGLLNETEISQEEIKNDIALYNCLLSNLLSQSIRIPKHSHESIMQDFVERFGSNSDDNTIKIRKIERTEITLEDFRKKCDGGSNEE